MMPDEIYQDQNPLCRLDNLSLLTRWAAANHIITVVDIKYHGEKPMMILTFIFSREINAEYNHMIDLMNVAQAKTPDSAMASECYTIAIKLDKVLREGGLF